MSKQKSNMFSRNAKYDSREERKNIHIFTNGEETETRYFKSKKSEIGSINIEINIDFINAEPLKLVNDVLAIMNNFDDYWVVFDKDSFPQFDNAIKKATSHNLNVAYSNECFELWFLLHFNLIESATRRKEYPLKLTKKLQKLTGDKKIKYSKNSKKLQKLDIYSLIKEKENFAIKNAEKLLKENGRKNPSTAVHLLVERLNELKKD